ncbi:MAG: hypothetical protein NZ480_00935, partial [Bdellovibrionaceae bacterium]|nr:hypothetical protein [Pseudobdellovibrionaceae bacterium]
MEQILSQLNQKILTTEAQRRQLLQQMREDLDAQKMQLTHFIVSDVKKTQDEAQLEVEKSITAIDYVLQCDWQKAIKQFLNLPPQFECEFAPYGTILAI